MRMAEQAEEMRQAAESAALAARNQEIARKAAASEARRLKMEADVQVSLPRQHPVLSRSHCDIFFSILVAATDNNSSDVSRIRAEY